MRVSIAGGGRAAWSVSRLIERAGWQLVSIALRDSSRSELPSLLDAQRVRLSELPPSDLIFAAVPDDALEEVARTLVASSPASHLVHLSGSRSSDLFAPHPLRASLHPLAALPQPPAEPDLSGTLFVGEGASETLDLLQSAVERAGARLSRIGSSEKPLYHAAAVIGSNYVALLAESSRRLMEAAGVVDITAGEVAALSRSAIANWESRGIGATTGPIARGDVGTIERNLDSLSSHPADLELYRELGLRLARALAAADQTAVYQEIAEMLERGRAR